MDGTEGLGKQSIQPGVGTHHLGELPQFPGSKSVPAEAQVGKTHGMQATTESQQDVTPEGKSAIRRALSWVGDGFSRMRSGCCNPFKALSNAVSNIHMPNLFRSRSNSDSGISSEGSPSRLSSEGGHSRDNSIDGKVYVPDADSYKLARALRKNNVKEVVSTLVKSEEGRSELKKIINDRTPENYKFLETFEKFKLATDPNIRKTIHEELCELVKPEKTSGKYSTGFDDMQEPAPLKLDDNVYGLLKKSQLAGTAFRDSLQTSVDFSDESAFQAKLKQFEELDEFIIVETSQQIRSENLIELKNKYKDYIPQSDREELRVALNQNTFAPITVVDVLMRSEGGMQEISSICNKQYMPENYVFLDAVKDFENAKTPFEKMTCCQKLQELMINGTPNSLTGGADVINNNVYGEIFSNYDKGQALKTDLLLTRDLEFFNNEANNTELLGNFKQVEGRIKLDLAQQLTQNQSLLTDLRKEIA